MPWHGELTDEQRQQVLTRAYELQRRFDATETLAGGHEALVQAAEEVGLSRDAVEQALREVLDLPLEPPKVGDRVFARSSDGFFYVAEVLHIGGTYLQLRFLRGGEHRPSAAEVRPFALLPGTRIQVPWPNWGWYTCNVVSYDEETGEVKATDGWKTMSFHVNDVRLPRERRAAGSFGRWLGAGAMQFALGLVTGSVVTGLLVWFLTR